MTVYIPGRISSFNRGSRALIAALLLSACGIPQPTDPPALQPTMWVYECGDEFKFTAQFREDSVILELPVESRTLPRVTSASRIRYSDDAWTLVVSDGEEASLEGDGLSYSGCTGRSARGPWEAARLLGVTYRGLGQEPGWVVQIESGKRIYFIGDYGEVRVTTPAPAPEIQDGVRTYNVRTETHALTVTIRNTPCSDIMSGEPFPDTVIVVLDGREYRGCGRSLE